MVTNETFRAVFRVFADTGDYPDDAVTFYINTAVSFLSGSASFGGCRWGDQLDYGTMLFVAHHLALDQRDVLAVKNGGIPGELVGPATSKSVDKVSVNRDVKSVTFEDEAFWNQTRYGVQLMNLAKMAGMGGVQLGGPICSPAVAGPTETPAWPGGFGLWLGPEEPQEPQA